MAFRGRSCRRRRSTTCSRRPRQRSTPSLIVLLIAAAHEAIVRRLSRRRVCASCGITQSVSEDTEPHADPCPYCGGGLVRRDDDEPATIQRRLTTYASFAEPITSLYRIRPRFASVDGLRHADEVTAALCAHIELSGTRSLARPGGKLLSVQAVRGPGPRPARVWTGRGPVLYSLPSGGRQPSCLSSASSAEPSPSDSLPLLQNVIA